MVSILDRLKKTFGLGTSSSAPSTKTGAPAPATTESQPDAVATSPPPVELPSKVPKRIIVLCDGQLNSHIFTLGRQLMSSLLDAGTWNNGLTQGIDKITNVLRLGTPVSTPTSETS